MTRVRVRLAVIASTLLAFGGLSLPADAVSGIVGSCSLVSLQLQPHGQGASIQSSGGICEITEFDGVGLVSGAAQIGTISIWSPSVAVFCDGANSVRSVTGTVTFTVRGSNGNVARSFPNVSLILDSAGGNQSFNPTATVLLKGLEFAGSGAFTRQGSGNCIGRSATWTLGSLTFEDPAL